MTLGAMRSVISGSCCGLSKKLADACRGQHFIRQRPTYWGQWRETSTEGGAPTFNVIDTQTMHSLSRYRVRTCISAAYSEAEEGNVDYTKGARSQVLLYLLFYLDRKN